MSIHLDGLVKSLDKSLYPKDKIKLLNHIKKWCEHESEEYAEEEAATAKQRFIAMNITVNERLTVLKQEIIVNQQMTATSWNNVYEAKSHLEDINMEIEIFVHSKKSKQNNSVQLIESVKKERRKTLANLRASKVDRSAKVDHLHNEASKQMAHVHELELEYEHLIEKVGVIEDKLIHFDSLIAAHLAHHNEHIRGKDYLERRNNALLDVQRKRTAIKHEAHKKQVAFLDRKERQRQMVKKLHLSRPLSKQQHRPSSSGSSRSSSSPRSRRQRQHSVSPRLKAAKLRAAEYAKSLNKYIQAVPTSNLVLHGRTSPKVHRWVKEMTARITKWKKRPSDVAENIGCSRLPKSWGPSDMSRRRRRRPKRSSSKQSNQVNEKKETKKECVTNEEGEVDEEDEANEDEIFKDKKPTRLQVGDAVWIRYKKFPEQYGGVIKHVHATHDPAVQLYDVLYVDGYLEMGVEFTSLARREASEHGVHAASTQQHKHDPSISLEEETELEEDKLLDEMFAEAISHTNWGPDFRKIWDTETRRANIEKKQEEEAEEEKEKEQKRNNKEIRANKSSLETSYSYLNQMFHEKNPPIGRHKIFWIPPKGRPKLAVELPHLREDNFSDGDDDGEHSSSSSKANASRPQKEGSILMLQQASQANCSSPSRSIIDATILMEPSRRMVGGVPLRCDLASSKLHAQFLIKNQSPHRPHGACPWSFQRGVIKKQRVIGAPLHSSPIHSTRR